MNTTRESFSRYLISKRKYGEIYSKNETEEDKSIHQEIFSISNQLNNYYKNKKVLLISPEGNTNAEWNNINDDKNNHHPYINIYCTSALDINAFAVKIDNEYYMGICKGLLIFLKERIKNLVEDDAFSSIPEISMVIPEIIVKVIFDNCIKFMCFHEFFHINNGHCDLAQKLGINELCETSTNFDTEYAMIVQTLEYDADCCAIAALVNEQIRMHKMVCINLKYYNTNGFVDSTIQFLSSSLIGLYTLYNWINNVYHDDLIPTEDLLESMKHPVPGLRVNYIAINAFYALRCAGFFTEEDMERIVESTLNSLSCFIKSYNDVASSKFMSIIKTEVGINHLQKVHDNWEQVREMLLKTHFTELAPYQKFDYDSFIKGKS